MQEDRGRQGKTVMGLTLTFYYYFRLPFYTFVLNPVYNAARSLRSLRSKKQNNSLHQLIFKPVFLKVNLSDFSETFTLGNYML